MSELSVVLFDVHFDLNYRNCTALVASALLQVTYNELFFVPLSTLYSNYLLTSKTEPKK